MSRQPPDGALLVLIDDHVWPMMTLCSSPLIFDLLSVLLSPETRISPSISQKMMLALFAVALCSVAALPSSEMDAIVPEVTLVLYRAHLQQP